MNDISASERRLIAALDRLDAAIERGRDRLAHAAATPQPLPAMAPVVPAEVEAHLAAARADNRRLSDDLAALHERQGATLAALQARLAEAHERLEGVGQHAARLAAANDGLAAANRALIEAAGDWPNQGRQASLAALEAEVEALRAARAAEIAQMGEILDALDRMIGTPAPARAADPPAQRAPRRAPARERTEEPSLFGSALAPDDSVDSAPVRDLTVERDLLPEDDAAPFGDADDDARDDLDQEER